MMEQFFYKKNDTMENHTATILTYNVSLKGATLTVDCPNSDIYEVLPMIISHNLRFFHKMPSSSGKTYATYCECISIGSISNLESFITGKPEAVPAISWKNK